MALTIIIAVTNMLSPRGKRQEEANNWRGGVSRAWASWAFRWPAISPSAAAIADASTTAPPRRRAPGSPSMAARRADAARGGAGLRFRVRLRRQRRRPALGHARRRRRLRRHAAGRDLRRPHHRLGRRRARTPRRGRPSSSSDFIDAPVSGGQAGAENGALTVMCGGDEAAYRQGRARDRRLCPRRAA